MGIFNFFRKNVNESTDDSKNGNNNMGVNIIPLVDTFKQEKLSYVDYISNADSCCLIGDYKAAIKYSDEGILLKPQEPDAYGTKGVAYLLSGDKENALKYFQLTITKFREMQAAISKCKDEDELFGMTEYDIVKRMQEHEDGSMSSYKGNALNSIDKSMDRIYKFIQKSKS